MTISDSQWYWPQKGYAGTGNYTVGSLTLDQIRQVVREEIERAFDLEELLDEIKEIVHDEYPGGYE
jgi:hypothetical protein